MHLLVTLDRPDQIKDISTVDSIISAEIPDPAENPELYERVKSTMIHGPCGTLNPKSPCMKNGVCTKGFPKDFSNRTIENKHGYPIYRRRDNGRTVRIRNVDVSNQWVVPYSPYLIKKYGAHTNVEICSSIMSVKYIYKYIHKGYDCANIEIRENGNANEQGELQYDEITQFLDARYISSPEAMWRLCENHMHEKSHTVVRLPVHLPNLRSVYFIEGDEQAALQKAQDKCSQLTAWFELNNHDGGARNILYADIPKHYTFQSGGFWKKRVQKGKGERIVSRMYAVSPRDIERYHLRMLLCHVTGATCFEDLRTANGILFPTFKDACRERHLLSDDTEWNNCMQDAAGYQMPKQLRQLFVSICVWCDPSHPLTLWENYKNYMIEDFLLSNSEQASLSLALHDINVQLQELGKTLADFGLPQPSEIITCNAGIDLAFEAAESEKLVLKLTHDQRQIFDSILQACTTQLNQSNCFSVSAPGGCGKSFIFNALTRKVRSLGHEVICVASTGIAADLLPGGRTVHSIFKLPIPLFPESNCRIQPNSREAYLLISAKLIIWDECTMASNLALQAIERLLRDISRSNTPFGGKVIVLGGDWRQTLPVVVHSNRTKIIESCLKTSPLWPKFKHFRLEKNMRTDPGESQFAEWLLKLGDGSLSNNCGLDPNIIEIPEECIVRREKEINPIIRFCDKVFGTLPENYAPQNIANKTILCPKNEDSLKINDQVLNRLSGECVTYLSADQAIVDSEIDNTSYPIEYLNKLTLSGMPPHKLILKVGAIFMLLRNIAPMRGLCNGTRLIVRKLQQNVIEGEILTGTFQGTIAFIPRVKLVPSDTALPFQLQRVQFPVRLSYCITISKSQGQSFRHVGIYLPEPVFTHGQLYVAFSRAQCKNNVKVLVNDGPNQGRLLKNSERVFTQNVVYKEIFNM